MMHKESEGRKKARALISRTGHRIGGHFGHPAGSDYEADKRMVEAGVRQHERHDHPGEGLTKLKLADGGAASGEMAMDRGDRPRRGKHGGGKDGHKVNIIIAPQGGGAGAGAPPMAVRPPMPPPAAPHPGGGAPPPGGGGPPPPMPPPGGMGPMAGAPMGVGAPGGMPPRPAGLGTPMPPGGPPMLRKSGGRAGLKRGGRGSVAEEEAECHADGGRTGRYDPPKMWAGAGSGHGRLTEAEHMGYRPSRGGKGMG